MPDTASRLADLLIDPHEAPDLEIKSWLDINAAEHQAKLAKGIIAMANHGGGYILIGFEEVAGYAAQPSAGRPQSLAAYNRDRVNGIVEKYVDPPMHCELHHVSAPDGLVYPVIVVPGGHRSPVMAKRNGPAGGELRQKAIYIRRAGPKSEEPQTAQEMVELFDRCFSNRRDEVADLIRSVLAGASPTALAAPELTPVPQLSDWVAESCTRWATLVDPLPEDDPKRFPLGHLMIAYQLRGPLKTVSAAELLHVLQSKTPRHTGWPPFWVPTRPDIAPYPQDGVVECWLGRDSKAKDAAHADFWRISPKGFAFLMRGYQEDGSEVGQRGYKPGAVIDVTVPAWRVGEALLHARMLATELGEGDIEIVFRVRYTGLAGRTLVSVSGERLLLNRDVSRQHAIVLDATVDPSEIQDRLPEIVQGILAPFYELFDFFQPPATLVPEEIAKMRAGRF
jgi:Putative DNA-binding domain